MTDLADKGKPRRILAPYPWPLIGLARGPVDLGREEEGPLFYLSWPGWELFLKKRLDIDSQAGPARPLLLPDVASPELDFAAVDQLVRKAGELGAAFLHLEPGSRDSENTSSLIWALRHHHPEARAPPARC